MSDQRPAPRRFVVPTANRRHVTRGEPSRARFDVVALDGDTDVVLVPEHSRAGWEDVAELTGAPWVAPVLVDASDRESYPTGEVVVRFAEPPSDAELRRIERAEQVRAVRRNSYVASQVVFAPAQPEGMYLPDLCARLEQRHDVASVWLSTKSRYTKG
ncbi:MAG: hypothetical protein ACRDZZ_02410 [Ilumatobacteraceae bacterium]